MGPRRNRATIGTRAAVWAKTSPTMGTVDLTITFLLIRGRQMETMVSSINRHRQQQNRGHLTRTNRTGSNDGTNHQHSPDTRNMAITAVEQGMAFIPTFGVSYFCFAKVINNKKIGTMMDNYPAMFADKVQPRPPYYNTGSKSPPFHQRNMDQRNTWNN